MAPTLSTISEVAIAFLSLFGGFMKKIAPPEGAAKIWTGVASLMAGIGFLAVKLLAYITPGSSATFWTGIAFVMIAASVVLFFIYDSSFQKHTVLYNGEPRIAGSESEYTQAAQAYRAAHHNPTRDKMLFEYTGNAERVWEPEALRKARRTLGLEYALFIAFLAFGLNLAVEVLGNTWNVPPVNKPLPPTFKERASNLKEVHFALDRTDLDPDAAELLSSDAAIIVPLFHDFPKAMLLVDGYCDDQGSAAHNFDLGYRRAENVRDELARRGVPAERMRVASHGKNSFLCEERTEECRQKNRRVQLIAVE